MKALHLKLHDFRNYARAELSPAAGITALTGDNAQGKTALLEALYLCCTGRSHRTARDRDLIRWGQPLTR
ncbi:MAG: AAA family ATPase, partial [Christensenellaceae bacterium]|nr:AAA family ATPase [Christensenellaceae bacterium]